ncbi:HAD-IIA family hydrolase [Piscibacillus sp. B03]|uniref:HAD-IIA family hydrolase n=1 Tax=Piscibacillus sp. B03 TaxID=3457430 RepID=UPI003FCE1431
MKGYIFDLDGTVYLDDEPIKGAVEAINKLKSRGNRVVFLTNKSIARRTDYVRKLNSMGILCTINEVVNSNFITARFLKSKLKSHEAVFVIGERPLYEELDELGIQMTDNPLSAAFVVVGWDRQFNYEKLSQAFIAYQNGAKIIATNPDRTCPTMDGMIPDCGAMIGAIEGATGKPVDFITGKPSKLMIEYVVNDIFNIKPNKCYMIGDRLETDIVMADDYGVNSVLVLTGITKRTEMTKNDIQPTFILNSVAELDLIES